MKKHKLLRILMPISLFVSCITVVTSAPASIMGKFKLQEVGFLGHYAIPSILPADLDKDGDIDLVLASEENGSIIQVYENLGNAIFRNSGAVFPFESPDLRHWNFGITVADFNEDGLPDIATADAWAGLNLYFNLGNLRFAWLQNYVFPGMGEVKGIASADLNGDGQIDIILGDHNGDSRGDRILLNDGTGRMIDTGQSINRDITWDVFAIDIDRDGATDYISVNRYASEPTRLNFNNGLGVFDRTVNIPDSLDDSYDIKCFSQGDYTYCFIANSEGERHRQNRELVFDKKGTLIADKKFGRIGAETKDLSIIDINSDGLPDLIAANYNGESVAYFAKYGNKGMLVFDKSTPLFSIGGACAIGCADFNGDGAIDLIVGVDGEKTMTEYRLLLQQLSSKR